MVVPEPITFLGFSTGILGFVFSTISTGVLRIKRISWFNKEFMRMYMTLMVCHSAIGEWDAFWDYETHIHHGEDTDEAFVYQQLWKDSYFEIKQQRQNLKRNFDSILKRFKRAANIQSDGEVMWFYRHSKLQGSFFRKVQWSLFTQEEFKILLDGLEKDISNLKALSNKEFERLKGSRSVGDVDNATLPHLGKLIHFGRVFFQPSNSLNETSNWMLELRIPQEGPDVTEWRRFGSADSFDVRLSFSKDQAQRDVACRITLQYNFVGEISSPDTWQPRMLDNQQAGLIQNLNPAVTHLDPYHLRTQSFRNLFMERFFSNKRALKLWQNDRANLLLSLANWTALLWHTDWTANLCCSDIRFVRANGDNGGSFHSLGFRRNSDTRHQEPNQDVQVGRQQVQEQQQARGDFNQGNNLTSHQKFVNLGLALAEIICQTPFRLTDDGSYEKWETNQRVGEWEKIRKQEILQAVLSASTNGLYHAVSFCLDPPGSPTDRSYDGIGFFYNSYVENVLMPFWANEREGLKGFLDESVISKLQIISDFRWPDDAIENQATNEAPRAQFDLQPRDPESRIPGSWVD